MSVSHSPCVLLPGSCSPLATRNRQMSAPATVQASENHSVRYSPMAGTVRAGIHEPRQPMPTEYAVQNQPMAEARVAAGIFWVM